MTPQQLKACARFHAAHLRRARERAIRDQQKRAFSDAEREGLWDFLEAEIAANNLRYRSDEAERLETT